MTSPVCLIVYLFNLFVCMFSTCLLSSTCSGWVTVCLVAVRCLQFLHWACSVCLHCLFPLVQLFGFANLFVCSPRCLFHHNCSVVCLLSAVRLAAVRLVHQLGLLLLGWARWAVCPLRLGCCPTVSPGLGSAPAGFRVWVRPACPPPGLSVWAGLGQLSVTGSAGQLQWVWANQLSGFFVSLPVCSVCSGWVVPSVWFAVCWVRLRQFNSPPIRFTMGSLGSVPLSAGFCLSVCSTWVQWARLRLGSVQGCPCLPVWPAAWAGLRSAPPVCCLGSSAVHCLGLPVRLVHCLVVCCQFNCCCFRCLGYRLSVCLPALSPVSICSLFGLSVCLHICLGSLLSLGSLSVCCLLPTCLPGLLPRDEPSERESRAHFLMRNEP